jgi:putative membrane protein
MQWALAALHLLALGIGLGSVWTRGSALRGELDTAGLRRVFTADVWWGAAAFLWISSGLVRLLVGLEKNTGYYFLNHLFWGKMALLAVILALEIVPMLGLIRWRMIIARGGIPDTTAAGRYATISRIEAILVVIMVILASGMARGFGMPIHAGG